MQKGSIGHRLVAVFGLGALLLNAPLLGIFDQPALVFGIPLLYAYVFGVWIALVAMIAWVIEAG